MRTFVLLFLFSLQCSCVEAGTSTAELPLKTIVFSNGVRLTVELAVTAESRQKGLMNRDKLEQDRGMLFQFDKPHFLSFWMKDTYIPLEIGFFTKDKKLSNTLIMKPQVRGPILNQDLRSYRSREPCVYALEVNPSWFTKNKISVGSTFRFL